MLGGAIWVAGSHAVGGRKAADDAKKSFYRVHFSLLFIIYIACISFHYSMLATLTSTCLPIDTAKFRPITLFLRGVLQGIGRRISHRFDNTAGISHGNRAVGNVLNDHRTGPNRAAMTDGYARKDGHTAPYPYVVPNGYGASPLYSVTPFHWICGVTSRI